MTQELIERTVREWVSGDTLRAARDLNRLARRSGARQARSADEIVDGLIRLAGQLDLAETRAW